MHTSNTASTTKGGRTANIAKHRNTAHTTSIVINAAKKDTTNTTHKTKTPSRTNTKVHQTQQNTTTQQIQHV